MGYVVGICRLRSKPVSVSLGGHSTGGRGGGRGGGQSSVGISERTVRSSRRSAGGKMFVVGGRSQLRLER